MTNTVPDIDLDKSFIGCLALHGKTFAMVDKECDESSLTNPQARFIYNEMQKLYGEDIEITQSTLASVLSQNHPALMYLLSSATYAANDLHDFPLTLSLVKERERKQQEYASRNKTQQDLAKLSKAVGKGEIDKNAVKKALTDIKKDIGSIGTGSNRNGKGLQYYLNQTRTFEDLIQTSFPPVWWVVKNLFPPGLTILAGRPKVGKSFFCLDCLDSVGTGKNVLGCMETVQGTALYISMEDFERRLNKRLNDMNRGNTKNVLVIHEFPLIDNGCKDTIRGFKKKFKDLKLIVIDTMTHIIPQKKKRISDYEHYYPLLTSLQKLSHELELAIVLIHHTTKGEKGDNVFDGILGSVALQGAVDTMIVLERLPGKNIGTISSTSRDYGDHIFSVEFDDIDLTWRKTHNAPIKSNNDNDIKIAEAIAASKEGALTRSDIQKITGIPKATVNKRVNICNDFESLGGAILLKKSSPSNSY
jgi:RecA-family ATPase